MGARQRLNGMFFSAAVFAAALAGFASHSWLVFLVALPLLIAGLVISTDIRLRRHK